MPKFDGTGPNGQGARTGQGLGRCVPGLSKEEKLDFLREEKVEIEKEIAKLETDAETETLS